MDTLPSFLISDFSATSSSDTSSDESAAINSIRVQRKRTDIVELRTKTRLLQQRLRSLDSRRKALKKKDHLLKKRQQLLQQQLQEVLNSSTEIRQGYTLQTSSSSGDDSDCDDTSYRKLLPGYSILQDPEQTNGNLTDQTNTFRRFSPRRCSIYKHQENKTDLCVLFSSSTSNSCSVVTTQPVSSQGFQSHKRRKTVPKSLKRLFKRTISCSWC